MKVTEIKIDTEELKKEKQKNFKDRIWFINYWADYIKDNPDEVWSEQQKLLIDSQIKGAQSLVKKNKDNSEPTN